MRRVMRRQVDDDPGARLYATEVPWVRPPYRPAPTEQPPAETFSSPSKPRQYYARPVQKRELPVVERRWPTLVILGTFGVAAWVAFIKYANNQERLTSSVTQQILQNLRDSPEVNELLGDAIRPEPVWYLNGDPWVDGVISMPQGNVDLTFRVKGHKGSGTAYFTSIRRAKGEPFTILRFRIIKDDGQIVNIPITQPANPLASSRS
ncbi:DUF1783-domain-containing protein [Thelephora ganbajun]|uniref:DUF1783-domain-containing protein n=1 Tax=Thelephora ganbajun TaxID=370292 RepID=A0ACB6ZPT1_THEGA|nr:DUF1783-domain-containing protein [Thelephora ganbajun]